MTEINILGHASVEAKQLAAIDEKLKHLHHSVKQAEAKYAREQRRVEKEIQGYKDAVANRKRALRAMEDFKKELEQIVTMQISHENKLARAIKVDKAQKNKRRHLESDAKDKVISQKRWEAAIDREADIIKKRMEKGDVIPPAKHSFTRFNGEKLVPMPEETPVSQPIIVETPAVPEEPRAPLEPKLTPAEKARQEAFSRMNFAEENAPLKYI